MTRYLIHAAAACALLANCTQAGAELRLPSVIGDNMVLQHDADVLLWGWSDGDVTVTPAWSGNPVTAKSDPATGRWEVRVHTGQAGFEPQSLTVAADGETKTLGNILFGEVWLCSGQSNMEMPLRGFGIQPVEGAAQAIAYSGRYPGIRVHTTPKLESYTPQGDAPGSGWKTSEPRNAGEFSATAYYFARSLSDILNVPVGLIVNAYGGSKAEGWLPREVVERYPDFDIDKEATDPDFNNWERVTVMHNAMLLPLAGYTIRGFLWNQGESNVGRHETLPGRMADLVAHWRGLWGDGTLPFYMVEIPAWEYDVPEADHAARLREAQHRAAREIPNCGIVCTTDLVYPHELKDIHASQKEPIGERLAFMAAARTYGVEGVHADYPTLRGVEYKGDSAVLTFNNRYGGFTPNIELPGFEVAGADRVFHKARAVQNWNDYTVTLTAEGVDDIKAVRYCFKNFSPGRVHDMLGLPLVPFRTDDWE